MRFFALALLLLLPALVQAQDILPCRCSVADVTRIADSRGYSYPRQWVITDPISKRVLGEMWDAPTASVAMYGSELLALTRKIAALPASPATDALKAEAAAIITKIEAARK